MSEEAILRGIDDLRFLLKSQCDSQQERDAALTIELAGINKHLGEINGNVIDLDKRVTLVEDDIGQRPSIREMGEMSARLNAVEAKQPTQKETKEQGALEAEVKQGGKFRERAWQIISAILVLIITILITAAATGAI